MAEGVNLRGVLEDAFVQWFGAAAEAAIHKEVDASYSHLSGIRLDLSSATQTKIFWMSVYTALIILSCFGMCACTIGTTLLNHIKSLVWYTIISAAMLAIGLVLLNTFL